MPLFLRLTFFFTRVLRVYCYMTALLRYAPASFWNHSCAAAADVMQRVEPCPPKSDPTVHESIVCLSYRILVRISIKTRQYAINLKHHVNVR